MIHYPTQYKKETGFYPLLLYLIYYLPIPLMYAHVWVGGDIDSRAM